MIKIRKHKGINQQSGKLKKGFKFSAKKLKSGLPEIIKITQKIGGKYISKGSYGCIVSPAYNCKNSKISKYKLRRNVSKLSQIESIPEIFDTLALIDPNNKHFIYPYNICTIEKNIIDKKEIKKCQDNDTINLSDYIILNSIMKKGSNDLDKYYNHNIHINKAIRFLKQLLISIKLLTKHNILHLDIKAANILEYKNNIFIIDFDDFFNPTSITKFKQFLHDLTYQTYHWPPEVFMLFDDYPKIIEPNIKKYTNEFLNKQKFKMFIQKIMIYTTGLIFTHMQLIGQDTHIQKFKQLIQQMTTKNPYDRPNINKIFKLLN